jgi:hypothetical protein
MTDLEDITPPGDWHDVQPVNLPFTYLVKSSRRWVMPYHVDLQAYRCNGACDCPDFQMRHEPLLVRGAKAGDATRCKHIKRAMKWQGEWSNLLWDERLGKVKR